VTLFKKVTSCEPLCVREREGEKESVCGVCVCECCVGVSTQCTYVLSAQRYVRDVWSKKVTRLHTLEKREGLENSLSLSLSHSNTHTHTHTQREREREREKPQTCSGVWITPPLERERERERERGCRWTRT
jgi:hypothetical protein